MTPTRQGSIRLFRIAGVDVFLHWSWFVLALIEINQRQGSYSSITWNALEYLSLFGIVLCHELGHALACRQVGGQANQIVLWPLGGVAYVRPPARPGATLWSIAAGPLVNVILVPVLGLVWYLAKKSGLPGSQPDVYHFIQAIGVMNFGLLIFNLLPIYPLDGGQILQSLLWFIMGRARSLMVASIIGIFGVISLVALAFMAYLSNPAWQRNFIWICILGVFIALNCFRGWAVARVLLRLDKAPRRPEFQCPVCHAAPPVGNFWACSRCRTPFDTFLTGAICPKCGEHFAVTACFSCGRSSPMQQWVAAPPVRDPAMNPQAPPPIPSS